MHRTKVPPMVSPAEAQRKYPQGVCRIRSAAKLLTAALWGSVGKGGDAQWPSFSPLGENEGYGAIDDVGAVSCAD